VVNLYREWTYIAESLFMFVLKTVAAGRWRLASDNYLFGKKIFVGQMS
jgi:hypothetical protein